MVPWWWIPVSWFVVLGVALSAVGFAVVFLGYRQQRQLRKQQNQQVQERADRTGNTGSTNKAPFKIVPPNPNS